MTAPFLDLVRHAVTSADRDAFYRRIDDGTTTRVIRGVAVPTAIWDEAEPSERHRILVHAALATTHQHVVVARRSAAVLHRLPWVGALPPFAEVISLGGPGRSTRTIEISGHPPGSTVEIDSLPVTALARTLADVARAAEFEGAVVAADAAAARDPSVIAMALVEVAEWPGHQGAAKAAAALEFADPLAETPGESLSRASIARARLPRPVLQAEFPRLGGGTWRTDFWWPKFGVLGEFDGRLKYSGPTASEVVLAEKAREDELRAQVRAFVRWGWDVARSPVELSRRLIAAGVSPVRSSAYSRYIPAVRRKIGGL